MQSVPVTSAAMLHHHQHPLAAFTYGGAAPFVGLSSAFYTCSGPAPAAPIQQQQLHHHYHHLNSMVLTTSDRYPSYVPAPAPAPAPYQHHHHYQHVKSASDASSTGCRTPDFSSASSSCSSDSRSPSGTPCGHRIRQPYPSSPAECASLAAASASPLPPHRNCLPVSSVNDGSMLDSCIRPVSAVRRPFTIESILGLDRPAASYVDAALDVFVSTYNSCSASGKRKVSSDATATRGRTVRPTKRRTLTAAKTQQQATSSNPLTEQKQHCQQQPSMPERVAAVPAGEDRSDECTHEVGDDASSGSSPPDKHSPSSSAKCKRVRTIFTPEQLEKLETEFEQQQYMVGPERLYLAASLNLTEAQVKVWFQNRRIKWRKQHLELQQARLAKIREESELQESPIDGADAQHDFDRYEVEEAEEEEEDDVEGNDDDDELPENVNETVNR